jgi:hypothetical protein
MAFDQYTRTLRDVNSSYQQVLKSKRAELKAAKEHAKSRKHIVHSTKPKDVFWRWLFIMTVLGGVLFQFLAWLKYFAGN